MCVRTKDISSYHVKKQVREQHCETNATKALQVLQAREHQSAMEVSHVHTPTLIPPMRPVQKLALFLAVYTDGC